MVRYARQRLREGSFETCYGEFTEKEINGLGKNLLQPSDLTSGETAYTDFLKRYALHVSWCTGSK
jgi:hypothetical protein